MSRNKAGEGNGGFVGECFQKGEHCAPRAQGGKEHSVEEGREGNI